MGLLDNDDEVSIEKASETLKKIDTKKEVKEDTGKYYKTVSTKNTSKRFCVVIGKTDEHGMSDTTGKTGIVLQEIARYLKENPDKYAFVLDIDDSLNNLIKFYPDVVDRIYYYNPIQLKVSEDGLDDIDYLKCVYEVRKVIKELRSTYKEKNIGIFMFDGLTTYVKWCEDQMKAEKYLDADGKVSTLFYQIRNRYFFGTMYILKTLELDTYLIGHDNFLNFDQKIKMGMEMVPVGKLQKNLSNMCEQRIICEKVTDEKGNRTLVATIDKCRGEFLKEGKSFTFMDVKEGKVNFDSKEVFKGF